MINKILTFSFWYNTLPQKTIFKNGILFLGIILWKSAFLGTSRKGINNNFNCIYHTGRSNIGVELLFVEIHILFLLKNFVYSNPKVAFFNFWNQCNKLFRNKMRKLTLIHKCENNRLQYFKTYNFHFMGVNFFVFMKNLQFFA